MATVLRPTQWVKDYQILGNPHRGNYALSYPAIHRSGSKVFLKQYKSPSVTVPWYKGYVAYQAELKKRIEGGDAKRFCLGFVEFFEAKAGALCYFQAHEFIEVGNDLGDLLSGEKGPKGGLSWDQRLAWARLFMAGMAQLHDAKVVHTDLKPANVFLVKRARTEAGFVLKLIDFDFSILPDRKAPWHGEMGYVGTFPYLSPEHLNGQVPLAASDVFTCALILYELIGKGHPYADNSGELEVYKKLVLGHRAKPPEFRGDHPGAEKLRELLHRALSPDPGKRPATREIHQALLGEAALAAGIRLVAGDSKEVTFNITSEVGSRALKDIHPDSVFFHEKQFILEKGGDGKWCLVPNTSAPNETLLNGRAAKRRTLLNEGDVLAVGREAKGVVKLPMTVRLA
jgi:serine/threonine protein kinase